MRPRTLIALASAISLTFTLSCPAIAPAYWTPVNHYTYQIQTVCRDGLIIDIAYNDPTTSNPSAAFHQATVWTEDANPPYTPVQKTFPLPRSKTTSAPPMSSSLFNAMYLGRNNKLSWTPARAPGSLVWIAAGTTDDYYLRAVADCSITNRFDPFTVGYVSAHFPDPATYPYRPDQFWSYNSTMQTNSVMKVGTGAYTVTFPGLAGPGGNAQVTAYGAMAKVCKLASPPWTVSGSAIVLNVRCFLPRANGVPADAEFTASYTAGYGTANTYAFAFADQPTNPNTYTPNPAYQYNNSGGRITIKRNSVGKYTAYIPNNWGTVSGGSVKVTAAGATNTDCKVGNFYGFWYLEYVNIWCFAGNGLPADSYFSMVFMDGMNHLGSNIMAGGYVQASNEAPSMTETYTPPLQYNRVGDKSGNIVIRRAYPGNYASPYEVLLPFQNTQKMWSVGKSWDGGDVQVSAFGTAEYGAENMRCQVGKWMDDTWNGQEGRMVTVYCFDTDGRPAQSNFTLLYTGQYQL